MLYGKAYAGNGNPAAKSHDNRFAAVFDKVDNVRVQSDCSHCHNDKEFTAKLHQCKEGKNIAGNFGGKNITVHAVIANCSDNGSNDEIQNEHRKCRFYAGFICAGRFFRLVKAQNQSNRDNGKRSCQFDDSCAVQYHCACVVHTVPRGSGSCNG